MTDDPEIRGPKDVGRDPWRDFGDEPPPAWRDSAPDPLAPIDESAPVSGHVPAPPRPPSAADQPEHDWNAAQSRIYPLLRPPGMTGLTVAELDAEQLAADQTRSHSQPLVDEGPCGIAVVYAMRVGDFDVIVNGDHLLGWGVPPTEIQDAAIRNLSAWSANAPWTVEESGGRRLVSSDTGDGWDASRILLPDTAKQIASHIGEGRILVGLPERDMLVAGSLRPGDADFADLFTTFVLEQSGGADEPIDRRPFELVGGHLVEFGRSPTTA
jgi:uncharacterized protein YtpQ (UPF0354 family)